MKKFLSGFLATLISCFGLPLSGEQDGAPEPLPSVIKVGCFVGSGSAVFIQPHLLVSAAHLMSPEGCEKYGLFIDRNEEKLEVVSIDPDNDLLLLRSTKSQGIPLPVREDSLKYGETVWVVGYPGPNTILTITKGVVSSFEPGYTGTDAVCYFGNSGGAAIDNKGQLIGILLALNPDTRLCYFSSLSNLHEFLNKNVPTGT